MGKSNRIKANHAEKKIVTPVKRTKRNGMPLWLKSVIAAVVALAILAVCLMGLISSNGVIGRYRKALSTDNFSVSQNMFTYMFMTQYSNFVSQNSSYLSSYGLDTTKSLKDQAFGENGETWYDYFENLAVEQATQLLLYCEEANARNIELDDDDKATINEQISSIKAQGASYVSVNAYIAANYGEGIKIRDIKKVIEMSTLASKAQIAIQEEIEDALTFEEVQALYNKDAKLFNNVNYSTYSITVNYKDVAAEVIGKSDYTNVELEQNSAKVLEAYQNKIGEAKATVEALKEIKVVDDFNKKVFELSAIKQYDTKYKANTLDAAELPAEDIVNAVKDIVIKNVVDAIVEGKDKAPTAYTVSEEIYKIGENTVSKKFAEFIDGTQSSVFSTVLSAKNSYIIEKATYTAEDKFSTWAYDAARAANDTTTILAGDGENVSDIKEIKNESGTFTANAYILTKTQYPDEALSKNFAYSVYSSEEAAKAAIAEFAAGTLSVDNFKAVAEKNAATGTSQFESYVAGRLEVDAFDAWIFNAETTVDDYTETPIAVDESTYLVAYYYSDSDANWIVSVKSDLFSTKYTEYDQSLSTKYSIKLNEKVLDKVEI